MIDLTQPIRFYDDTGKDKDFIYVKEILYKSSDKGIAVARVEDGMGVKLIDDVIVFEIVSKVVLSDYLDFWLAENYDPRHKPATDGDVNGSLA